MVWQPKLKKKGKMIMRIVSFLIKYRKIKLFFILLKLAGIELPKSVKIRGNIVFPHLGGNIVIHPNCVLGNNVKIFQGVTIGRADPWNDVPVKEMGKIYIEDGACICAGAKILCLDQDIYVGKNSVIAANAVLNTSTGDNEIWGGIPARKIREIQYSNHNQK